MYETGGSPYSSNYEQSPQQSLRKRDIKNILTQKGLNQSINKFPPNLKTNRDEERENLYAIPSFGGVSKSMG